MAVEQGYNPDTEPLKSEGVAKLNASHSEELLGAVLGEERIAPRPEVLQRSPALFESLGITVQKRGDTEEYQVAIDAPHLGKTLARKMWKEKIWFLARPPQEIVAQYRTLLGLSQEFGQVPANVMTHMYVLGRQPSAEKLSRVVDRQFGIGQELLSAWLALASALPPFLARSERFPLKGDVITVVQKVWNDALAMETALGQLKDILAAHPELQLTVGQAQILRVWEQKLPQLLAGLPAEYKPKLEELSTETTGHIQPVRRTTPPNEG